MSKQQNPTDLWYLQADAVRLGRENRQHRINHKDTAVNVGLQSIDDILLPLLYGELMTIIARPGGGKTAFMLRWARDRAKYLMDHNMDRIVIYASCEQTIEELDNLGAAAESGIPLDKMARGEIDDNQWMILNKTDVIRGSMRIAWIGKSYENRRKRPKITPSAIANCIYDIEDKTGLKADVCFVDYLQLMKADNHIVNKQERVTDILEASKDAALETCGWIMACQARREVDTQRVQIPGLDSGQWTSGIEQFSDKVLSLVRPSKYRKQGEMFGDVEVKGHCQMLVSLLKQKLGKDNIAKWVYFDPAYNKLHELEHMYEVH